MAICHFYDAALYGCYSNILDEILSLARLTVASPFSVFMKYFPIQCNTIGMISVK